jgi:hypothetical protein
MDMGPIGEPSAATGCGFVVIAGLLLAGVVSALFLGFHALAWLLENVSISIG